MDTKIAIIGMSCKVPDAEEPEVFWKNILGGVESVKTFQDQELLEAGVPKAVFEQHSYVKRGSILKNIDSFDAAFFNYSPKDAEIIDPQHRLFLECAWEALEDAGCVKDIEKELVGVYTGSGLSHYFFNVISNEKCMKQFSQAQIGMANENDFLAAKVAYKLGLNGPAINIQTACSSSLVAVHVASQSLLNGECDIALAGGVTVRSEQVEGYTYKEGGLTARDGHCKVFDVASDGTVFGNGLGVVVLKRAEDAVKNHDNILAIISGTAINNDGKDKIGFTAPSLKGQANVISEALSVADLMPEDITYIETHGTGTKLGDEVEIGALKEVYGNNQSMKQSCALGSVKPNVGHLGHAAGIIGLIKTVLALKYSTIPPCINHVSPNPKLLLETSSFYVNTRPLDWKRITKTPKAAVSSFGIGGSNAHVIVEEAPLCVSDDSKQNCFLLNFSAKSFKALQGIIHKMKTYMKQHPDLNMAEAAYTLQNGRADFGYRRMIVCSSIQDAICQLEHSDSDSIWQCDNRCHVLMLFPGHDVQMRKYAYELYQSNELFASKVEIYLEEMRKNGYGITVNSVFSPDISVFSEEKTSFLILDAGGFLIENALADTLSELGIQSDLLIAAGDGLFSAVLQSGIIDMASLLEIMRIKHEWKVALRREKVHIEEKLSNYLQSLKARTAKKAVYYYNTFIRQEQLFTIELWLQEETKEINLAGISVIKENSEKLFIQIGARTHEYNEMCEMNQASKCYFGQLLAESNDNRKAIFAFYQVLGEMWLRGITIDWKCLYQKRIIKYTSLPTYCFDKKKYWVEAGEYEEKSIIQKQMKDWFYSPTWKRAIQAVPGKKEAYFTDKNVLVFVSGSEKSVSWQIAEGIKKSASSSIFVRAGETYHRHGPDEYTLNPEYDKDYELLFADLRKRDFIPDDVIHMWSMTSETRNTESNSFEETLEQCLNCGYDSLSNIAKQIDLVYAERDIHIKVISNQIFQVSGEEECHPVKATLLGAVRTIPAEFTKLKCSLFDVNIKETAQDIGIQTDMFLRSIQAGNLESVAAFRHGKMWNLAYEQILIEPLSESTRVREHGKYLIAGGLGGLALSVSFVLANKPGTELILVSRSAFPEKVYWDEYLNSHTRDGKTGIIIRKLKELEQRGAVIHLFQADIGKEQDVQRLVNYVDQNIGEINGVIQAAGVSDGGLIRLFNREKSRKSFHAKIKGTYYLDNAFAERNLDFFIMFSSTSSIVPAIGQESYCGANAFLDAFAMYSGNRRYQVKTINWCGWADVGMSVQLQNNYRQNLSDELITQEQGNKIFSTLLDVDLQQVIISKGDFNYYVRNYQLSSDMMSAVENNSQVEKNYYERPDLTTAYEAPVTQTEWEVCKIWEERFNIRGIGTKDSLIELGGDSISVLTIQSRIFQKYEVNIPISYYFEHPTIAAVCSYLEKESKRKEAAIQAAELQTYYPLSSIQRSIYFLQKLSENGTAYNNMAIYKLEKAPDLDQLKEIFNRIIQRHEILRTSFHIVEGQIMQKVNEQVPFHIQIFDGIKESEIQEIVNGFIGPYDLNDAPLMRVGFIAEQNILMIDMHHLVSDETSYQILVQDLMEYRKGKVLADLQLQYKDYAQWQSNFIKSSACQIQKKFWLAQFLNDTEGMELNWPFDFKRPKVQSFQGDYVYLTIGPDVSQQFKKIINKEGATLNMGLLAVYSVLISKICQQDCMITGIPVSGRRNLDFENVIGSFVDTLALKITVHTEHSFLEHLKNVKKVLIHAFDNRDYPFEELVGSIGLKREISRNPLFDNMFSFRETHDKVTNILGVQEITGFYKKKSAMFSLRVTTWEDNGQIYAEFEYCTELFKHDTVEQFASWFKIIIEAIVKNCQEPISAISLLNQDEKNKILYDFNNTAGAIDLTQNTITMFERIAEKYAGKMAVTCTDTSVNYKELNEKANRLAHYLKNKGAGRDMPVGVYLERSVEVPVTMLAILKIGGYYVPIAPDIPQQRVAQMIQESNMRYCVSTGDLAAQIQADVLQKICIDREESEINKESDRNLEIEIQPEQTAYVIFTSGSTGKPKGVMVPHRALFNFLVAMSREPGISDMDRLLSVTTISFDIFGLELYLPLTTGASIILATAQEILNEQVVKQLIEKYDITLMQATPAMWKMLLMSGWKGRDSLTILCGGERLSSGLAGKLLNCSKALWNMYGPTETTIWSSVSKIENADEITIGKPILNTQMYILDKNKNPLPAGIYGELYIGGLGLATQYLHDEAQTGEKFIQNPFDQSLYPFMYKTGDIARLNKQGKIEYLGRMDSQIKLRGYRIELSEIELAVASYPGIEENQVILEDDEQTDSISREQHLVCYFVSSSQGCYSYKGIRDYLLSKLPVYMVPQRFYMIEKMPLNANGKIDRKALLQLKKMPIKSGGNIKKPETELELKILEIWDRIIGCGKISTLDSFFDVGGTSMAVVFMQEMLQKEFQVKINTADIFFNPTIKKLGQLIEKKRVESENKLSYRGTMLPDSFYFRDNGKMESVLLVNELSLEISRGLFHVAEVNGIGINELFLGLFIYLIHQLSMERAVEVYVAQKEKDILPLKVDFSHIKDFNSLFALIKEIMEKGNKVSMEGFRNSESYSGNLFMLFAFDRNTTASDNEKFNVVFQYKVVQGRLVLSFKYDNLVFKGKELKKILVGFEQLARKFLSITD